MWQNSSWTQTKCFILTFVVLSLQTRLENVQRSPQRISADVTLTNVETFYRIRVLQKRFVVAQRRYSLTSLQKQ